MISVQCRGDFIKAIWEIVNLEDGELPDTVCVVTCGFLFIFIIWFNHTYLLFSLGVWNAATYIYNSSESTSWLP